MLPSEKIVKGIIYIITMISGPLLNSSIVVDCIRTWRQKHQLGVPILFYSAVTNILQQCSITFGGFLYIFDRYMMIIYNVYVIDFAILYFLIELSFWHATWLSIYYCLKLVNLPCRFFFQLKSLFFSTVPLLLVGSIIGSLLINIPFLWTLQITIPHNMTGYKFDMNSSFTISNMILGCCFPFLITLTSIVLSISSLLIHIWKVKSNEINLRRPQLKAHIGAVRTMVTRLILDLLLCLVSAGLLTSHFSWGTVVTTACWVYLMLYSTFQAMVIILGNPKLKSKMFSCRIMRH